MRRVVILTVCLFAIAVGSFAQTRAQTKAKTGYKGFRGEKGVSSFGVIAGYAVDNQTVLLGVDYRYNIKDRIRLAPSVLYALKSGENKMDTWYVNADAHYLARLTERFTMYPIGGLGLSMWAWDVPAFGTENPENPEETEETEEIPTPTVKTSRETKMRVGLNIGIGCENRVTDEIVIGVEFKYNLTTERIYNQAMLSARVAYYF